jgi:RNA polymerase sigma-70 factor (ECF subfamily)
MTDEEAIAAIRGGNDLGMDDLISRHQIRALKLAFQITRDRPAAEDIVAEAFIALFRAIKGDRYRDGTFAPWFFRVVTNRAISEARRGRLRVALLTRVHHSSPAALDPEDIVVRHAQAQVVNLALRSIRPRERAALSLRYVLDLDDKTVADIMGCPVGTVKTLLHRGRTRLRAALIDEDPDMWPLPAAGGME